MFHKLNTATTSELYISAQHISGKMHVEYCRIQLNSYRNSLEELKNTNTVLQEHINRLTKSQEEQILQLIAKSEEAERIRISAVEHSEALRKSTDSLKTDYEESDRYTIKLKQQLDTKEKELTDLASSFSSLQLENTSLTQKSQVSESNFLQISHDFEQLKLSCTQISQEHTDNLQCIQSITEEKHHLSYQLENLKQIVNELEKGNSLKDVEMSSLLEHKNTLASKLSTLEAENKDLKEQFGNLYLEAVKQFIKGESSMKMPEKPKEMISESKKIVHFEEPEMTQTIVLDRNLCMVCSAPPYGRMKKCATCSLPVHARCAGPVSTFICSTCSRFT